jgi:hypothetical protein
MAIPKYLEAFRQAAREAETCEKSGAVKEVQTREESEVSGKRGKQGGLNSLNALISHPEPPQNPPESDSAVCAVCNAAGDLWHYGEVLVHQECAAFLAKPEPAEPSTAYQAASAEPDGTGCKVEIVELPATGLRYRRTFALQLRPPAHVPEDRWRQAVEDGRAFLRQWGEAAQRLGWDSRDLFGLHAPPEQPAASYTRLSRYHATGLIWLLDGRKVLALTEITATILNPDTGTITTYRRFDKPSARATRRFDR